MQTTRTINLVQSLPLVPLLLGVTELELSQQPSGQLKQTAFLSACSEGIPQKKGGGDQAAVLPR